MEIASNLQTSPFVPLKGKSRKIIRHSEVNMYCKAINSMMFYRFVFLIPAESGEKITLGISTMLNMTVFLMTVMSTMLNMVTVKSMINTKDYNYVQVCVSDPG
jgi:hypothetical protein